MSRPDAHGPVFRRTTIPSSSSSDQLRPRLHELTGQVGPRRRTAHFRAHGRLLVSGSIVEKATKTPPVPRRRAGCPILVRSRRLQSGESSGRNCPDPGTTTHGTMKVAEPLKPTAEQRLEIAAVLHSDDSALGDVFRRTEAGESPDEIQQARGAKFPNFVYQYQASLAALLEGDLPTAPSMAIATARRFKRVLRAESLSDHTRSLLQSNLALLEVAAASEAARVLEDVQALRATEEAEARELTGVYVYSLPHYLRYPYDPESGRTLLKIGRSDRDVIARFRLQTRTTALPEEPVLLRVYVTNDEDGASQVERKFHRLLEAADHDRSTARTGGTEWFLTSVRFLDEIASTLHLNIDLVYDPPVEDA
jgi:hypothetical protein